MVYEGPQHKRESSSGSSHVPPTTPIPKTSEQAEQQRHSEDHENQRTYHPSDPETKIHWVREPKSREMPRAQQEKLVASGQLPPVFGEALALIDYARAHDVKLPLTPEQKQAAIAEYEKRHNIKIPSPPPKVDPLPPETSSDFTALHLNLKSTPLVKQIPSHLLNPLSSPAPQWSLLVT